MKRFEAHWDSYLHKVLPRSAGDVQVSETRQAFYAGGMALFSTIMLALSDGEEATETDLQTLNDLKAEFDAFERSIVEAVQRMRPRS